MWKVMIADDEPYIREGLEKLIPWGELGCELVYVAQNGQELLAQIQKDAPDIAVIDIKMPLMDGMEVAEYIYKNHIRTSVIFLTAYADFQYARKAIQYQVSDYIVKTAALEEIPVAIENIKQRLESETMTWYRMILVTPVHQGEKVRKFFLHAFHSFEYRALSPGSEEEGLILTVKDSEQTEEILNCCEKMRAFCKNFLGEFPQILCSRSYQQGEDSTSIYEQTKAYGRGKTDNGNQIFIVPKEQETEEEADTLLKRVQTYIRNHYTERLTLADIAEKVHVSASYLSRFYKQKAGENQFDTINSLRVEKAKELLIKGDKKIYEIAALTGFEDTAYFSKVFKKYAGCPPKEYEQSGGKNL